MKHTGLKKPVFCLSALKLGGLTPMEHSSKLAWESKTPEQHAEIVARTKIFRFASGSIDERIGEGVDVGAPA